MYNVRRIALLLLTLGAILISMPNHAAAQVWQEWAALYNGPDSGIDRATCLDFSAEGPIFVSGRSDSAGSTDIVTIMYSEAGVPWWAARYDGPAHGADGANDLIVDELLDEYMYVYVTGFQEEYQKDFVTLKYNTSGQLLWVQTYDGSAHDQDEARALAADGPGNVIVTGYSTTLLTSRDFTTIKYNQGGVQQWIAHYNGPANSSDEACCLAVDNTNNVYVVGFSDGDPDPGSTNYDVVLVKYNSAGVQQWVCRYNGPGNGDDQPTAMALAENGDIYITGHTYNPATYGDCLTLKFEANGSLGWAAIYSGADYDYARAIGVDGGGHAFITGQTYSSGMSWCITLKYDAYGVQQWMALYGAVGSDSWGQDLVLDAAANVYITGASTSQGTDFDIITMKYDANSTQQWVASYNGSGNGLDLGQAIALNPAQEVLVAGFCTGDATDEDYVTIKYSQLGPPTPVVLTNFSANSTEQGVKLTWQTASEIDCYGWQVQRCQGDQTFQDVSPLIPGYGTSAEPHDYAFQDYSVENGQTYLYRLKQIDLGGAVTYSDPLTVTVSFPAPSFRLDQNFPNPFNAATDVRYQIPDARWVSLRVYDTAGRLAQTLVEGWREAGEHKLTFDGSGLPSGVYLYRLQVSGLGPEGGLGSTIPTTRCGKMVLLK